MLIGFSVAIGLVALAAWTAVIGERGQGWRDLGVGLESANVMWLLVAGAIWIIWQHRVRQNLEGQEGRRFRWGPGMAIGGWFIPLANLIIPFLSMWEVVGATAEVVPSPDPRSERLLRSGRKVLAWWWVGWVGRLALQVWAGTLDGNGLISPSRLRWEALTWVGSDLFLLVGGAAALWLLREVSRAQLALGNARRTGARRAELEVSRTEATGPS